MKIYFYFIYDVLCNPPPAFLVVYKFCVVWSISCCCHQCWCWLFIVNFYFILYLRRFLGVEESNIFSTPCNLKHNKMKVILGNIVDHNWSRVKVNNGCSSYASTSKEFIGMDCLLTLLFYHCSMLVQKPWSR